jgi:hypothetical protein
MALCSLLLNASQNTRVPLNSRTSGTVGPVAYRPLVRPRWPDRRGATPQSACFLKNAGISISSMPLLARASTFAAACVRPVRQTLGTAIWL